MAEVYELRAVDGDATETRELLVELTQDEIRERGEELAERVILAARLRQDKSEEMRRRNDDIKTCDAEVARLSYVVESGTDYRQVECEWRHVGGTAQLVRLDTGAVVEAEPGRLPL